MERLKITPQPVNTFEELLAKTNLILEATKQSVTDHDNELNFALFIRVSELGNDFDGIDCTAEQMAIFGTMLEEIREVIRQANIADLNSMYSKS